MTNDLELGPKFHKRHNLGPGVFYRIHELGPVIFISFIQSINVTQETSREGWLKFIAGYPGGRALPLIIIKPYFIAKYIYRLRLVYKL